MTCDFPLRLHDDVPYILDLDLAIALGFRRPVNLRRGLMQMFSVGLLNLGSLCRDGELSASPVIDPSATYYLNEEQAHALCDLSGSRRRSEVAQRIANTFGRHKGLAVLLRQALAREQGTDGSEAVLIDALKWRLTQLVRKRPYAAWPRRAPRTRRKQQAGTWSGTTTAS